MKNLFVVILFSVIMAMPATVSANHQSEESMAKLTAPVGQVYRQGDEIKVVEVMVEEPAVPSARSAETIYTSKCAMCHQTGVANAPKFGSQDDWSPRISKGFDALLNSAINGTSAGMPPRGMCMDCSDGELKITIEYMLTDLNSE